MTSPPYGVPAGPRFEDDAALIASFLDGRTGGCSERFHVEDRVLYRDRMEPAVLALGRRSFLARGDEAWTDLRRALQAGSVALIEEDVLLGAAVALQAVGLLAARWDLWAGDEEEGRWRLEAAAENWWTVPHQTNQ